MELASTSLESLIHENLIFFDMEATSRDDLIGAMAAAAVAAGYATTGYAADVIERENLYPTGLPTEPLHVAMPHAMVQDHVTQAAIVIARPAHPILFKEMGDGEHDVTADIVFLLVAQGDQGHMAILQRLICIFGNSNALQTLGAAQTPHELRTTLIRLAQAVEL